MVTTSIYTRISEACELHHDMPTDELAMAVLGALRVRGAAATELAPLVANEIEKVRRAGVRRLEVAALAPRSKGVDPIGARKQLMRETFWLPNGERVEWGMATAEQHEERAAFLEQQAATLRVTAGRHIEAAAQIRAAGVACLDEIEVAA